MLFTILPAALLAIAAAASSPPTLPDPNNGMPELDGIASPRVYWDAAIQTGRTRPQAPSPGSRPAASPKG